MLPLDLLSLKQVWGKSRERMQAGSWWLSGPQQVEPDTGTQTITFNSGYMDGGGG